MQSLITKSAKRLKEPVKLRSRKLANGAESLYLDIYSDGVRHYEFLKMYLLPEINATIKEQNKATLSAAEVIKAQRVVELNRSRAGIPFKKKGKKITLKEWLKKYLEIKKDKETGTVNKLGSVVKLILRYDTKGSIPLSYINKEWAKGFINWLQFKYRKENGKLLSQGSRIFYISQLSAILNSAVRNDLMTENPFSALANSERIKKPESQIQYLTLEELNRLIGQKCRNKLVKQAYIFSCYSGLRISDIYRLRPEDIKSNNGDTMLSITMKKTSKPIYIPLSQKALAWLPEKSKNLFFEELPTLPTINAILKEWSKKACINKKITFHTARHTFGTLMVTAGVDLYTVSKLMGHTDVRTTQIYAKVVDTKKIEAVKKIDALFK